MAAVLTLTTAGCATTVTAAQRRECRHLRGRMVARAIGVTLGAVVVLGVVVVAAAAGGGGSSPNFGGGSGRRAQRRQARRAERLAVCRETPTSLPSAALSTPVEGQIVEVVDVQDIPIVAVESGPPSVEELDAAIQDHADAVRACQGPQAGTLYVDARIEGQGGTVAGVLLHGPSAVGVEPRCVFEALQALRVRPFPGMVDVRWAIEVTGRAP